MTKTKFGVSQAKETTPQWIIRLTAILTAVAFLAPDLINSLPVTVPAAVKDWLEWGTRCVAAVIAILAVFTGKPLPPSYNFKK